MSDACWTGNWETPLGEWVDLPAPLLDALHVVVSEEEQVLEPERMDLLPRYDVDRLWSAILETSEGSDISGQECRVIGTSVLSSKGDEAKDQLSVFAFRYDDLTTLEVVVDCDADTVEVLEVRESERQPALSDDETQRAIEAARSVDFMANRTVESLHPLTIEWEPPPIEASAPGRYVQVTFMAPGERLPAVVALVDLTKGTVVSADDLRGA